MYNVYFSASSNAPASVTITDTTSDMITYTWEEIECGFRGGDITKYNYLLINESGEIVKQGDVINARQVELDGLDACMKYSFSIAGINIAGTGNYSEVITTETEYEGLLCCDYLDYSFYGSGSLIMIE